MRWLLPVLFIGFACGGSTESRRNEPKLASSPHDAISVKMAELLIANGSPNHAVPMLRESLAKNPDDARLHYLLGIILRDRGVYPEAERELTLGLRLAKEQKFDTGPVHAALGILYDVQGRPEDAAIEHAAAVEIGPKVARYHNNQGFSRYLAGDHEGAVKAYETALGLSPNARRVFVNLGFAKAALGDDDAALRMFRQVLSHAEALNNLALAHELHSKKAGKGAVATADSLAEARRLYQEALLTDPGLEAAANNLRAMERAPTEDE